jgi:uncharacterized membrane-anchored protein
MFRRIRMIITALLTALTLSVGLASPAAAAAQWHDTTQEFFWETSCRSAGQAGLASGWEDYDCKGSLLVNYRLWGKW